jgi:hypothetical protein
MENQLNKEKIILLHTIEILRNAQSGLMIIYKRNFSIIEFINYN